LKVKQGLLSRVTPTFAILAERDTTVPVTVTADTSGKLQMRLYVPNRVISDCLRQALYGRSKSTNSEGIPPEPCSS